MGQRGSLGAAFPRTRRKSNALAEDLKICAAAAVFIPIAINLAAVAMSSINPEKYSFSGNPIGVPAESVVPKFSDNSAAAPKNGILLRFNGGTVTKVLQDKEGNYGVIICTNPNTAAKECGEEVFPASARDLMVKINGNKTSLEDAAMAARAERGR
jgi:hypothetical protein